MEDCADCRKWEMWARDKIFITGREYLHNPHPNQIKSLIDTRITMASMGDDARAIHFQAIKDGKDCNITGLDDN